MDGEISIVHTPTRSPAKLGCGGVGYISQRNWVLKSEYRVHAGH